MTDAPGVFVQPLTPEHQGQLQPEKLVECQSASGGLDLAHGRRPVDPGEGRCPVEQFQSPAGLLGERVGEPPGPVECLVDQPAEPDRCQRGLFAQRIYRVDPTRRGTVVLADPFVGAPQDLHVGTHHLQPVAVGGHRTEEERQGPDGKLLGPPRLIEEDDGDSPAGIGDVQLDPGRRPPAPPSAGRRGAHPGHRGDDRGLVAFGQPVDRHHPGAVDVTTGVVGDQVEDSGDPELGQVPGNGWAHAAQHGHRQVGELPEASAGRPPGIGHPGPVTRWRTGTGRAAGRRGGPRSPPPGGPLSATR